MADFSGGDEAAAAAELCHSQQPVVWSRLPGQSCRVPATHSLDLDTDGAGCTALAFSADGRRLAVSAAARSTSTVRVYDYPSGAFLTALSPEVHGMVYELCFHRDGRLAAAAGDGTALVWATADWRLEQRLVRFGGFSKNSK